MIVDELADLLACVAAFGRSAGQSARAIAFPKGAVIRTLLKDVPPESLSGGPVLFHEHLSMHYPPQVKEHFTDDVGMMVEEVRAAGKDGIACIVDGGHPDMSRNLDALKRIAAESGVAIVASGSALVNFGLAHRWVRRRVRQRHAHSRRLHSAVRRSEAIAVVTSHQP
jgi:predicted metal-dependent phosphotriesterase family hydrolase